MSKGQKNGDLFLKRRTVKYRKSKLVVSCLYMRKKECESITVRILHIAYCSGYFFKNSDCINIVAFHYTIWEIAGIILKYPVRLPGLLPVFF